MLPCPGDPTRHDVYAGRDARGNLIALGATGVGVIPKRTMVREDDLEEEERDNTDSRAPRRDKKRLMDESIEFLGSSGNGARRTGGTVDANAHANANAIGDEEVEMMTWPVPSSV